MPALKTRTKNMAFDLLTYKAMREDRKFPIFLSLLVIASLFASCRKASEDAVSRDVASSLTPGKATDGGNGQGYGGGATPPGGNGQGYGGGDGPLADARNLYIKAVSLIRDGFEVSRLGDSGACSAVSEPILCNYLIGLTPAQKTFLQNFVKQNAAKMLALNTDATRIKFEFTSEALQLGTGADSTRDLAAKTALSNSGKIFFHEPSVKALSAYRQLALLAHEMGHKTYTNLIPSHYIGDTGAVGPFASGLVFLDSMGAALAIYIAGTTGRTAVTFPSALNACQAETINTLLIGSPYFQKPTSGLGGQFSSEADAFLQSLALEENFTVTAWVRVFNDVPANADMYGETILSNIDNSADYGGWMFGFGLFRLSNGNFGAYAGGATNKAIDSGAALTPGIFHHVAFKREAGFIRLYVDGALKSTSTALYHNEDDNTDYYLSLIESAEAGVTLGRAAKDPYDCKSSMDHRCMDYFEGHIAQVSFYKTAISDSDIQSLASCAPNR